MTMVIPTKLYRLTSPSGKQYIGVTKQDLENRITGHIQCRKTAIGSALRKHGRDSFKNEVLVIGPEDYIYALEQRAIETFGTRAPKGYNLKEGGHGGRHSKESKQKMSEVRIGIVFSEEHKRNISKVKTGLKVSEETRKKMSESQGRRRKEESVETRQNLSESIKKVRAKERISGKLYKKHTEETKKKMSISQKAAWDKRRVCSTDHWYRNRRI